MALEKAAVRTIAFLARIKVPEEDLEHLAGEMSNILGWVEQLAEVDTEGVEPMTSGAETTLPQREDSVTDGDARDQVLANAPQPEDGFYAVPKVLE